MTIFWGKIEIFEKGIFWVCQVWYRHCWSSYWGVMETGSCSARLHRGSSLFISKMMFGSALLPLFNVFKWIFLSAWSALGTWGPVSKSAVSLHEHLDTLEIWPLIFHFGFHHHNPGRSKVFDNLLFNWGFKTWNMIPKDHRTESLKKKDLNF